MDYCILVQYYAFPSVPSKYYKKDIILRVTHTNGRIVPGVLETTALSFAFCHPFTVKYVHWLPTNSGHGWSPLLLRLPTIVPMSPLDPINHHSSLNQIANFTEPELSQTGFLSDFSMPLMYFRAARPCFSRTSSFRFTNMPSEQISETLRAFFVSGRSCFLLPAREVLIYLAHFFSFFFFFFSFSFSRFREFRAFSLSRTSHFVDSTLLALTCNFNL